MLQSDKLAMNQMGLKVTVPNPANEVFIKERIRRKCSQRSAFASNGKKKVVEEKPTDETDEEESPEQSSLKRRM